MNATELYESGQLQAAIDRQIQEVKSNPGEKSKRLFLFDLLSFAGELDRAQRQIEAIHTDDLPEQTALSTYRKLLDAERTRRRVFEGKERPKFLTTPPEHVELRLLAILELSRGNPAAASEALAKAASLTPELKGSLNDTPFGVLIDCDDVFGTVLEVMVNGEYLWVPFEEIESITLNEPKYPIDILWRGASLETRQSRGDVFLPSLYPGSYANSDDQVRLGRLTDWIQPEVGPVRGVGVHTFLADERDVSLLEVHSVTFEVEADGPAEVEVVEPEADGTAAGV